MAREGKCCENTNRSMVLSSEKGFESVVSIIDSKCVVKLTFGVCYRNNQLHMSHEN